MSWAAEEFATVDLGDKRLNKRLIKVVQQWADKPTQSIPTAAGGWGDTAAAYRMLDNKRCDWREVLEAHSHCTTQRMAALPVVLCLTDTTELDFNGQTITGLGPLSFEAQRGMYLHPTYAVSTDREPLGLLDAWMWARKPKDANGQRNDINESVRWIESYERLAERAVELPQTRLDVAFFGANIVKIPHGGWFTLLIAGTQFFLMWTWRKGRALVAMRLKRGEKPIQTYIAELQRLEVARLPGTAVFLFKDEGVAPPALISTIEHFGALHETAVMLSIHSADQPTVEAEDRSVVTALGYGMFQVELTFGFMDTVDVGGTLTSMTHPDLNFDESSTTYFIGRETVVVTDLEGMPLWQERIFDFQNRTAASAARFFNLPSKQVFEVGTQVKI